MASIFNIVLALFNTVFRGYVIKVFWGWFIVTVFPTLPMLSVLTAIGLSYFVSVITPWRTLTPQEIDDMKDAEYTTISIYNGLLMSVFLLIILVSGWILHSFM